MEISKDKKLLNLNNKNPSQAQNNHNSKILSPHLPKMDRFPKISVKKKKLSQTRSQMIPSLQTTIKLMTKVKP